jgi:hypothetical protein
MKNIILQSGKRVKLSNDIIDNLTKLWVEFYMNNNYVISYYQWLNNKNFGIKLIETNPFKKTAYYEITDKELFILSRLRYGF